MGVDPGTNILGYSVICADKNTIKILINGVIMLKKTDDHFVRLGIIYSKLCSLIDTYQPLSMAIEAPFFGKNVQSMLKLGRAQGAAIVAGASKSLDVTEYSPRRIKQSISATGNTLFNAARKCQQGAGCKNVNVYIKPYRVAKIFR